MNLIKVFRKSMQCTAETKLANYHLVDFGFRLPSAYDNRPLQFSEFYDHINQVIYVSATPAPWEVEESGERSSNRFYVPQDCSIPKLRCALQRASG